jgi:hypothetical protein
MGLDYLMLEAETQHRIDERLREARAQWLARREPGASAAEMPPDPSVVRFFARMATARRLA